VRDDRPGNPDKRSSLVEFSLFPNWEFFFIRT
jgi:hypothetical protein